MRFYCNIDFGPENSHSAGTAAASGRPHSPGNGIVEATGEAFLFDGDVGCCGR
jgi:hypothetical protein